MMERIDQGIGQMLAALEQQGVADNTLFVFSSDNGGERLSNNSAVQSQGDALGRRHPRARLMRWPARLPKGKVTAPAGDHHGSDRDHPRR